MSYTPKPGVPQPVRAYMADLARQSRQLRTAVQADASAENGRKGGRPPGAKDKKPRKTPNRKKKIDS